LTRTSTLEQSWHRHSKVKSTPLPISYDNFQTANRDPESAPEAKEAQVGTAWTIAQRTAYGGFRILMHEAEYDPKILAGSIEGESNR
jgi:hypothetical protein